MSGIASAELKTDKVPAEYASWKLDQKIEWLKGQGLPAKRTVSLLTCYENGLAINTNIAIASKVMLKLRTYIAALDHDSKIHKSGGAVITAFNSIIVEFSHQLFKGLTGLLEKGEFQDDQALLAAPVWLPEPFWKEGEQQVTLPTGGIAFDKSFWGTFKLFLDQLINCIPGTTHVVPAMRISYAESFKVFVDTAHRFWNVVNGTDTGDTT